MSGRKGPTPPRPWQPLRFSHKAADELGGGEVYGNDRYTVTVHELVPTDPETPDPGGRQRMLALGIHTRTRSTVGAHDWRHFQRIKNEIAGPEREAVEIYPAESRLVDTANEYWLWVLPERERLHFGFEERAVQDKADLEAAQQTDPQLKKARQRAL
jgi:hypothetical protein